MDSRDCDSQLVTPVTVLLVEDSEPDAALVTEMLGQARGVRARVLRRDRLDAGLSRLGIGGVDVVLLDLSLPDSRGIETFEQVAAAAPEVPIIIMSAHDDEQLAATAVRRGAQDYLLKGQVSTELLGRAIQYALERQRLLASLRSLSLIDELTGLYNRRGFLSLAANHLLLAQRAGRRFVLLYGDLDGLKAINDTFGHPEGDRALARAAEVLRSSFRVSDVVARIGGDEFVVLAVEAASATEQALVGRVQRQFEEFNAGSGLPYRVTLSAGISSFDHTSPLTLDQMLTEADRSLYLQKRERRAAARSAAERSAAEFAA